MCCIIQDEFASLPAIVPKGPIAIFGLVTLWNNVDIFFEIIVIYIYIYIYIFLNQTCYFMNEILF